MNLIKNHYIHSFQTTLKRFRRRITYSDGFINGLASFLTFIIILYTKTLKIRWFIHPEFEKCDPLKLFYAFWHGRQFLLVPGFSKCHAVLMADISWAGTIQTKILKKLGYQVVRGSSKRKGVRALLTMKKSLEQGYPGGFALDGPRGPIYKAKPGILFLAEKMKYPIVPVASSAANAWIIKSTWCRYLFPKPFSKCSIVVGKPIWEVTQSGGFQLEDFNQTVLFWTVYADKKVGAKWLLAPC